MKILDTIFVLFLKLPPIVYFIIAVISYTVAIFGSCSYWIGSAVGVAGVINLWLRCYMYDEILF